MKCRHCGVDFFDQPDQVYSDQDVDGFWALIRRRCPACNRLILDLRFATRDPNRPSSAQVGAVQHRITQKIIPIRPTTSFRAPCPEGVPAAIKDDYLEACIVLPYSPNASAALSRRCLQHLLRRVERVESSNLANEIQEVLNKGVLPSYLADALDAVRNVGNFAAHPIKSERTGEVLPVEPGEAEWNLDVLESLFDFYFVQPQLLEERRSALNKKLGEAGKKPMK